MKEKQKHGTTAILALCVAILAIPAALAGDSAVSTVRTANAEESPVITAWVAGDISDALLFGEPPLVLRVEPMPSEPERVERYAAIPISEDDYQELAGIVYLEAGNQCAEGQQAVVEVILNRVISPQFPDNIHDVLHQCEGTKQQQFSPIGNLAMAEPGEAQYAAIEAALYGPSILPDDVVYFSRNGENDRVWGKIQDHVFCREYIWE